jgi:hypothetical protein
MTTFYYPASRLWPDYLRSAIGLAFCLGLMLFAEPQSVIFVLLAGSGLLFAWLGVMTLWRQQIEVELDASGIALLNRWGFRRRVNMPWSDLTAVDLRYYSTRRDRSEGWLQLTVKASQARLRVDSNLLGFPQLVQAAVAAADRQQLALSPMTRANVERMADIVRRQGDGP